MPIFDISWSYAGVNYRFVFNIKVIVIFNIIIL